MTGGERPGGRWRAGPVGLLWACFMIRLVAYPWPVHGELGTDIAVIAQRMLVALGETTRRDLKITTMDEDRNYMLPMGPIYRCLRDTLSTRVHSVVFSSFGGRRNAAIRDMIRNGDGYAPIALGEKRVDSLILTGCYHLTDRSSSVNFSLRLIDIGARTVFESGEFVLKRSDAPSGLDREIFSKLSHRETLDEIRYRGRLIRELETLFNTPRNNLLAHPAEYAFERRHNYAISWQVDALREILTVKYGIVINPKAKDRIVLEPTGAVVFVRGGKERVLDRVVDGEPLLPEEFPEEFDTLRYLHPTRGGTDTGGGFEAKGYTTRQERVIRDLIHETFSTRYPAMFSRFDTVALQRVFVAMDHPSVLVGRKVSVEPRTGREDIRYTWHTKESWLSGLKTAYETRHRRFRVRTAVIGVFCDNLDPARYWAIVRQKWRTTNELGRTVYEDDGFLFVNFDFDVGAQLKEFHVLYRLWFYNYEYDDLELGIKRHEKLIRDIDSYFADGISGIDATLKKGMRDFLVAKISSMNALFAR